MGQGIKKKKRSEVVEKHQSKKYWKSKTKVFVQRGGKGGRGRSRKRERGERKRKVDLYNLFPCNYTIYFHL